MFGSQSRRAVNQLGIALFTLFLAKSIEGDGVPKALYGKAHIAQQFAKHVLAALQRPGITEVDGFQACFF